MIVRPLDCLARVIATAMTAASFFCTAARAETDAGVGLSGNFEYSTNPFLVQGNDTGAVRGRISLSPFVEERTARSSLRVSSNVSYSKYSRRYDDTVDLSAQVGYNNRLTRQFTIRAGLSLNTMIGGANNINPIFEIPDATNVTPQIIDITLIGTQQRTTRVSASTGLTYSINDKNSLSLGYDASVVRYPQVVTRSEYSTIGQRVSYSRVFNSRASAGASVGISRINYFGGIVGDAVIISPTLDGTFKVAATWTVSGSVGLSLSRVNTGLGELSSTNLSGNVNMCRNQIRTNYCFNASRATAASSFDGIRTTSTVGATYSYRINTRDTLSASAGYSRASVPRQFVGPPTDYLSASSTFSRQLAERLKGQVTAGYVQSTFQGRRSNAYASIGVNYSFGNR